MADVIREKLQMLPDRPGVYLMRGGDGEILYVGKAKSLRSRVRSYFGASAPESLKTRELVNRIHDVDTIVVSSEAEALMLENNLIKEHQPRFNINLRDDKTYPYIKVTTGEPFPRVFVTRKLSRDRARYFGPYTDVRKMRQLLEVVKRIYTVRSCRYRLPNETPDRPCLDYHIGRCLAPCVGLQSQEAYGEMIAEVLEVLEGHTRRASQRIREEMTGAAAQMHFERAAELRDALTHLEKLESQQRVFDVGGADRDVLGLARDGEDACGVVMRIREGRLLRRETIFLENVEGEPDAAVAATFATRFYTIDTVDPNAPVAPEILLPTDFDDRGVLEELLRERAGHAVWLRVPQRGEKARLVALAAQNARHLLEERKLLRKAAAERAPDALYELQEVLGLPVVPRFLVCFDISHTQGTETVASAIGFRNGEPDKSEYRRMRIRGEWGNDDFQSMREAVARYFRRRVEEEQALPDLVVIDGGKGQLGAARAALDELGLPDQAVISLAKKEEEVFLPALASPVRLPRRSAGLRLLQRARDESHRFAVGYNRKLRGRRTLVSEIRNVPGVGGRRQRALLERFGSVRALRDASEEEIARVPGIGPGLARTISAYLNNGSAEG